MSKTWQGIETDMLPLIVQERIEQAWAEVDRIMTERMGKDWREQKYVRM